MTHQRVVTLELNEHDAHRLMWLAQREAQSGLIWDDYWARLANDIQNGIEAE